MCLTLIPTRQRSLAMKRTIEAERNVYMVDYSSSHSPHVRIDLLHLLIAGTTVEGLGAGCIHDVTLVVDGVDSCHHL